MSSEFTVQIIIYIVIAAVAAVGLLTAHRTIMLVVGTVNTPVKIRLWRRLKCPYCKDQLIAGTRVLICEKCKAIHHIECWQATRTCSVFGCATTAVNHEGLNK